MWELLQFLLNAILFVLIGLQLPVVLDGARGHQPWTTLLGYAAAVSAAVVLTRLIWQQTVVFLIRALDRRESRAGAARRRWQLRGDRRLGGDARRGLAGGRARAPAGLRAARPADLPHLRGDLRDARAAGADAAAADPLARRDRRRHRRSQHEELKARLVATKAALARIEELKAEEWTRDDTLERMQAQYEYRKRRLAARAGKIEDDGYEDRSFAYQTILREVLEAQRAEIVRLRNEGTISNEVMHRIERELDLEDQRLEI